MPDEMNICLSVLIECSDICGIASISRTFGSRTMNWPSIFTLSSVILSASLVSGNEPAATGSDMAKWFTGLPKTLRCRVYTVVISMAPRSEPRGWLREARRVEFCFRSCTPSATGPRRLVRRRLNHVEQNFGLRPLL